MQKRHMYDLQRVEGSRPPGHSHHLVHRIPLPQKRENPRLFSSRQYSRRYYYCKKIVMSLLSRQQTLLSATDHVPVQRRLRREGLGQFSLVALQLQLYPKVAMAGSCMRDPMLLLYTAVVASCYPSSCALPRL